MENALKKLFDYQRIAENPKIQSMINATQQKYMSDNKIRLLSDDDLTMINAAGDPKMKLRGHIHDDNDGGWDPNAIQ